MVVDDADYDVWRAAFGSTTSSVHDAPLADGNYDGVVDAADYVVWRDHFGQTGPAPAAAWIVAVSTRAGTGRDVLLIAVGVGLMLIVLRRVQK